MGVIARAGALPFIQEFLSRIDEELQKWDASAGLTRIQKLWIGFCLMGILLTNSVCWSRLSRWSFGRYSVAALSWMFRKSKVTWDRLLLAAVMHVIRKYDLKKGTLVIDDTDRKRSKNTEKIHGVHKILDKKTQGFFQGQCLMFLVLVTDKVTIPVGFQFYIPDPMISEWNKQDQALREKGVPKKKRPPCPEPSPGYRSKIELAGDLVAEFKKNFPQLQVEAIIADAAFGSAAFFARLGKLYPKAQVISQLRSNQKVRVRGKWAPLRDFFQGRHSTQGQVCIRGGEQVQITSSSARLKDGGSWPANMVKTGLAEA